MRKEKEKQEADVSVACGKGRQDACEGLMNSCFDKDSQIGIYGNPSIIKCS